MSTLDKLAEEDESVEAFRNGVLHLLETIDDPEVLQQAMQEEGYEEALEHIDMEQSDYEVTLEMLYALAQEIGENHPELLEELADELGDETFEA